MIDRIRASLQSQNTSILGLAAWAMATVAIALIATAMVFAIATGTNDTADQGEIGILSEASLSAAAATKNGIVQAQVIAEANGLGLATAEDLAVALGQTETISVELLRRIDRLTGALADSDRSQVIATEASAVVAQVNFAVAQIRAGNLTDSAALIEVELDSEYRRLAGQLAAERDAAMTWIALAGENAGRVADAARFMVVLLAPLMVLLTYRKRARRESAQRDLKHQLEKQQAVSQTQDEFIANLSHELRTPLTAIYGFSLELIESSRPRDPGFEREMATYIASESADLSRMVEDILTAASADQNGLIINVGPVDPVAEVESVLGPLRATGARIESSMSEAKILTDALRFRQVIRNLVSNALRYGGPNNLVFGRTEGNEYIVEIRDDGPGIPAGLEERLFTRFIHKGDEPLLTGSVGLGLAIAQLLTESTGGIISYRRDGNETVFAVRFPLAIPARPIRERSHPSQSTGPSQTRPSAKLARDSHSKRPTSN